MNNEYKVYYNLFKDQNCEISGILFLLVKLSTQELKHILNQQKKIF